MPGTKSKTAAEAIMTTDTFPKGAVAACRRWVACQRRIMGFAKGSGMIAPDMATMLGYVFTDAAVARAGLQSDGESDRPRGTASTPLRWTATPRHPTA
jgi:glutamate N-acetyltransferase/amino-acid N-acetyltransferase